MSRRISSSNSAAFTRKANTRPRSDIGIVVDVIYDDTHPRVVDLKTDGDYESKKTELIGSAVIRPVDDMTTNDESLRVYKPYDSLDISPPLIGESVQLVIIGGVSYYKRIFAPSLNKGNAQENLNKSATTAGGSNEVSKNEDYSQVSSTGTPSTATGESDRDSKLGEYFVETQINPLKLYEGDRLIQSRFGQSIRFSGFNNTDNVLAPIIVIRNRQSAKITEDSKPGQQIEEDWIDDGSTIAITSGEYEIDFTPGTLDTPLETEPIYTEEPELKGTDQILINTGRLILSSKDSEMMFYSKGNYSFVSDGKLTIDNGLDGAEIDLNGEYRTTTNDNDMYFLGGNGKIYLNTESDAEPLVRGEVLKGLLERLIDAINQQVFSTPAGPTAVGPNNKGTFNTIKSELQDFLSTLNYTE